MRDASPCRNELLHRRGDRRWPDMDVQSEWMARMRHGDWAAAWRLSDTALAERGNVRDRTLPRHLQPVWNGGPVDGRRVLVRCYHGLGDTLQFVRFLPALMARAREVTLWAQPVLIPLLTTLRPCPRLLPLHDGTPDCAYDLDIEVMELPHLLRTTPATLPRETPYLHPPRLPRRAQDGHTTIGLVWRAGDWDRRRSIPFDALRPLIDLPGIDACILQRGPGHRDAQPGLADIGTDDVLAAASAMTALDLVVTVDSMPAHLAGALGIPVWLLLAQDADWRWMEGRRDSPWYPSMRLFRQHRPGDWSGVVAEVVSRLSAGSGCRRLP